MEKIRPIYKSACKKIAKKIDNCHSTISIEIADLFSIDDRDRDRDLNFQKDRDRDRDRDFGDRANALDFSDILVPYQNKNFFILHHRINSIPSKVHILMLLLCLQRKQIIVLY